LTLRPSGFIALPHGERTGFDHADSYLDRDGSRRYVAHTAMSAVDVLDCRGNSYLTGGGAVTRLPLRGSPDVVLHDERRHSLYVAIGSPGLVTVFDTERLEELQTVETEDGAHTIGWDPVTAYAFAPRRGALLFEETA
jgi:hypothetical protein